MAIASNCVYIFRVAVGSILANRYNNVEVYLTGNETSVTQSSYTTIQNMFREFKDYEHALDVELPNQTITVSPEAQSSS
jgi:hypothetical protein